MISARLLNYKCNLQAIQTHSYSAPERFLQSDVITANGFRIHRHGHTTCVCPQTDKHTACMLLYSLKKKKHE